MATLRATNLRGRSANDAPNLPDGANITGVCTATSFAGDGSSLTGIDATTVKDSGGTTRVAGNTSGIVVTGVSTLTGNVLVDGGGSSVNLQFKDTSGAYQRMGIVKDNDKLQLGEYNNAGDTFTDVLTVSGNGDRVIIGHDANIGGSKLQSNTTGAAAFEATSWYNGADATGVSIRKSRGSTPGDYTVVQDGDGLGSLNFAGADGTDWANGARIKATVNGTPGSNDMPTKLEFFVSADGTENLTERLEVNSSGITVVGTVAATAVTGDGSGLTNLPSAGVTTTSQYSASGIITINLGSGQAHEVTLAAGISTITVTGGTVGESHSVIITQPSSGITTVGFSTYFLWPSGSVPNLSKGSASSEIDMITFVVKQQTQTGTGVTQLLASAGLDYH